MYQPVIDETGLFGTTIEFQGQITKVNFPLVTGLFDDSSDEIFIVGNGILEFVDTSKTGRNSSRRLAIKLAADENDGRGLQVNVDGEQTNEETDGQSDFRGFDLQVEIEPPMQAGCLAKIFKRMQERFKIESLSTVFSKNLP